MPSRFPYSVVLLCIARIARFSQPYEQACLTARFGDDRRYSLTPDSDARRPHRVWMNAGQNSAGFGAVSERAREG